MFGHILRHEESLALKLGLGYSSFIFGILKDQSGSLLLCTDALSGPPSEIKLNPKLFRGLHKTDTQSGNGSDALASTDDSTFVPTPKPPHVAPDLTSPPPMDSRLATHLQAVLCLL